METIVRKAGPGDALALHQLAAATFPLACPATTKPADIAEFIGANLSEGRMAEYLADPDRVLFLAETGAMPVGYTMLVLTPPTDDDVLAALTLAPSVELSKCYVLPGSQGSGVASALVEATVQAAAEVGAAGVWLGVNQLNARANAFYERSGFRQVGTKRFLVGSRFEHDFVRERAL